jgi:apolipoprotein N-acyltransferase
LIGAAIWWARTHHIQVVDWQPTLLGWLGVLFAFILARVFMIGTALREDVEGTI